MAEGSRLFFLQLIEMSHRAHWAEARREEAKKGAASLRSALDAERVDLEAACDNAQGIFPSKRNLDKALASAEGEVDEAIRKAAGAGDKALQSLAESPTIASRARSPLTHDPGEGLSFGEKALIVQEPMTDLNQEGPGLSEGSELFCFDHCGVSS
ncbi:hypothetical protein ACLOJK_004334 [Asimina triloba]